MEAIRWFLLPIIIREVSHGRKMCPRAPSNREEESDRGQYCTRLRGHPDRSKAEGRVLVVESRNGPTLLIDESGDARLIRSRERQGYPYERNVYVDRRKRFLEHPFEQPMSSVIQFYQEAVATCANRRRG